MPQPVKLKIKFKSANLDQFIKRYSVDVSRGGIFVRTKNPLEVGTKLRFEFLLQDASPLIVGEGTVVWIREYDPGRKKVAPGMGVRFDQLSPESEEVLQKILAKKGSSKDRAPKVRGEVATGSFLATDSAESKDIDKEKKGDSVSKPDKKSDETGSKAEKKVESSPEKTSAESAEEVSLKTEASKKADKKEVEEAKAEVEPAKKAEKSVGREAEEKAKPAKKHEKETESKETKEKDDKEEVEEAKEADEAEEKEEPAKKPVAKAEESDEKNEPAEEDEKKAEEKEVEEAKKEVKEEKSDKEPLSTEKSSPKDNEKGPPVEARSAMDEPQEGGALWPVAVLIGLIIVAIAGYIVYQRTRTTVEDKKAPRPAISEKPTADAEVEDTGDAVAGDLEEGDASVPEQKCDKVEVEVISDPPDATVFLDDQKTDKTTPAKLCLEEGSAHKVELKKDGFKDYSFPKFKTKPETKLNAKLTPMVYSLLLSSRPRGATVLVDGEIHGCKTTCNLKLPFADEWTITLRRRGYEDEVIKLKRSDPEWKEITSGFRYRHYVELNRIPSAPIPRPKDQTRDPRKTPKPQRETTKPSETDETESEDGTDKPDKEPRPAGDKKPDKEPRPAGDKKPDKEPRPAGDKKPDKEPRPAGDKKPPVGKPRPE